MIYTWGNIDSPWLHEDISVWQTLTQKGHRKCFKKGSYLFHADSNSDYVYVVISGRFRITTYHIDGGEKQLYIAEVGALFGESESLANIPYKVSALALQNSEVYCISSCELRQCLKESPELIERLLQYELRKTFLLQQQVVSLSFEDASKRIAKVLLDLCELYGREVSEGMQIGVKFTKRDIAGIVGTSRVTASLEFTKLRDQGIVTFLDGYYLVKNMQLLRNKAGK